MIDSNVTPQYVKKNALIQSLQQEKYNSIKKYVTRAVRLIEGYIDVEQFFQEATEEYPEGQYVFPNELMDAIVYIVEYLYSHEGDFGKAEMKSEKIGNYQYIKKDDGGKLLDLPLNIISMLQKYRTAYGTIEPSIADVDREYTD